MPAAHGNDLLAAAGIAAVYFGFSVLLLATVDGGHVPLFACANAVLLARLLATGPRRWAAPLFACFLADIAANLVCARPLPIAVSYAMINLVTPVAAAGGLRALAGAEAWRLDSPRAVIRFVAVAGLLAPALGATPGAAVQAAGRIAAIGPAWTRWLAVEGTGVLLVTPLLMMIRHDAQRERGADRPQRRPAWLRALLLTGTVAASTAVFFTSTMPLLFVPALLVVLAAVCLGRIDAAAAVLAMALVGAVALNLHSPQLAMVSGDQEVRALFLQLFVALVLLTALPVATSLEERERLVGALATSEQRFRTLAEDSTDLIIWADADGVCRYASPAAHDLLGRAPESLVGHTLASLVHREDRPAVEGRQRALTGLERAPQQLVYRARHADGRWLWLEARGRASARDGVAAGVQWTVRDISAQKSAEAMLAEAANTDALTALANRRAFTALLDIAVTRAHRHDDPLCLAIIDLDHFKHVNDSWGHDAGDEALRRIAAAWRGAVREGDLLARLGGEEFGLLMPDTPTAPARLACERLRAIAAATAFPIGDGGSATVTVSIGLALLSAEEDSRALIRAADRALYAAKQEGRDRVTLARDGASPLGLGPDAGGAA